MQQIKEEKAHSELSASGSVRWFNCPGSVALSRTVPKGPDSKYAQEGTLAHEALEKLLKKQEWAQNAYPPEMVVHVRKSADAITKEIPEGSTTLIEGKSYLTHIKDDMHGTVDVAVVDIFGTLKIIDFKYGAGIAVDVKDNTQLIYYALGVAHQYHYNFTDVELIVVQPRADHPDGPIRRHKMPIAELKAWEEIFRKKVADTQRKNAPLNFGYWCKFCPAKHVCPAVGQRALEQAQIDFPIGEDLPPVIIPPAKLQIENLSNVLKACDKIEMWIEGVREYALHQLKSGQKIKGFKLVQKRATRKWIDEIETAKDAATILDNRAFKTELHSPTQMEKLLGKDWVESRCAAVSSGVTIASEFDKRPNVNSATEDFCQLD